MSERLTINYEKKPCYDIVFAESFAELTEELSKLNISEKKVCVVTDSHVKGLYGDEVMSLLAGKCKKNVIYSFPAGEENKTLDTVREAYRFLIEEKFDRKDF